MYKTKHSDSFDDKDSICIFISPVLITKHTKVGVELWRKKEFGN